MRVCPSRGEGTPLVVTGPLDDPHGPAPVLAPRRGPHLRIYAERPRRRVTQLVADLAVAAWIVVVVMLAVGVHDLVTTLEAPAQGISEAGGRVRDVFSGAAGVAADVPLVGDRLARALDGGVASGDRLVAAGEQQTETVRSVATGAAWALAFVLLVPVVPWWLALRVRWMLRARAVLALRDGHHDADLLALRALMHGSPARLTRRVPGAANGWRARDPSVLARLAALELARLGLRPGRTVHTGRNGPVHDQGDIPPPPGHTPPRTP